ncbi:aspartate ammonia-lyase [Paraburkholderia sp. Clong3]|uniref:lyase family protein n=1 Tax=Paraburkholderia sp. Clong3 TaxID=2991061 RepID=UPI003D21BE4E
MEIGRPGFRVEYDSLGEREIPEEARYGIHTPGAVENCPISGTPVGAYPNLRNALAAVKQAVAEVNAELHRLEPPLGDAIVASCVEAQKGRLCDQCFVDVTQGRADTENDMNANEVICNRALELLGRPRGDYVHLDPGARMCPGGGNVYSTALRISICVAIEHLCDGCDALRSAFVRKAEEFRDLLQLDRTTQLYDAVHSTLGFKFLTHALMLDEQMVRLRESSAQLREIYLRATIDVGATAHSGYEVEAVEVEAVDAVNAMTALGLPMASTPIERTQECAAYLRISGILTDIAVELSNACSDLHLISIRALFDVPEIDLAWMRTDSFVTPGRPNAVISDVVRQMALRILASDVAVTFAAESVQVHPCKTLAEHCIREIAANSEQIREMPECRRAMAPAANSYIGGKSARIPGAHSRYSMLREAVLHRQLIAEEELDRALRAGAGDLSVVLSMPG